jgi:hypothetical protein
MQELYLAFYVNVEILAIMSHFVKTTMKKRTVLVPIFDGFMKNSKEPNNHLRNIGRQTQILNHVPCNLLNIQ